MKTLKIVWCLIFFFGFLLNIKSQDKGALVLSELQYGLNLPLGAWGERYGLFFGLGSSVSIFDKKRRSLSFRYQFSFGSNIKEDILAPLRSSDGSVISNSFQPTFPILKLRGHLFEMLIGKWMTSNSQLKGIWIQAGPGFLQHKINIQDDADPLAQLQGESRKGYDRLTNGLGIVGSLGYQYISQNRQITLNFSVHGGLFFTKNKRGYNFDLHQADLELKRDGYLGLTIGWIIPILYD